jgi:hypothetical protein
MLPEAATIAVASRGSIPLNQPVPIWQGSDIEGYPIVDREGPR